jgi:hypothetical protein
VDNMGARLWRLPHLRGFSSLPSPERRPIPRSFISTKGVPASECLQKNYPASSNVLVKDFTRWYCLQVPSWPARTHT